MRLIPDTEGAKVLIALGAATTVFTIALLTLLDSDLTARKWMIYALLGTAAVMLGVDYFGK